MKNWGSEMYIRFNNQITVSAKRNGQIAITPDTGEDWETQRVAPSSHKVTDWWASQHMSDIRHWQKDICVGYVWDIFGPVELFNIYRRGGGYQQQHDICLVNVPQVNIWILSTSECFWIKQVTDLPALFQRKDSIGSILDKDTRIFVGNLVDTMKLHFNPDNRMHTK